MFLNLNELYYSRYLLTLVVNNEKNKFQIVKKIRRKMLHQLPPQENKIIIR